MLKKVSGLTAAALLTAGIAGAAELGGTVIVTSSNTADNHLRVYDTAGTLIQEVPTLGQGGAGGNAGGIATSNGTVAVVNFGSQTVSLFSRGEAGFELRQTIPTSSQPVSVAFGKSHLYVLGTTTVESHRIGPDGVDSAADGTVGLLLADGSAAQVGVAGDELIVSEKGGVLERVLLREGTVFGTPLAVAISEGSNTPFGLTTRGSNVYVTFAGSDTVGVVKNDRQTAYAATGIPGGDGQHAPCWITVVGPYLFTTNSPSHSISRLIAAGANILLDEPLAAQTAGAPIDVAAEGELLALVESDGDGTSHLTQFRIDEDGNLTRIASTPIASRANGIAIVSKH
jgi:hypothetical protein